MTTMRTKPVKSKIKMIPRVGLLEGCTVKLGQACWRTRLLAVYGPAPAEIAHMDGFLPHGAWSAAIAGLTTPSPMEWLEAPRLTDTIKITSNGPALADAIDLVSHIAERDSARNYASVIALDLGAVVATDGFRLAYSNPEGLNKDLTFCLPVDSAEFICKFLRAESATVEVSQDLTTLIVICRDWVVYARLSAVKFPQWRAIIPKLSKTMIAIAPTAVTTMREQAKRVAKAKVKDADWIDIMGADRFTRLNARYFADATDIPLTWYAHTDDEDAPLLGTNGNLTYVLVPIKKADPIEHKTSKDIEAKRA